MSYFKFDIYCESCRSICLFVLLGFYAVFDIISVISRRQFNYLWSLSKQTSTRLENVHCLRHSTMTVVTRLGIEPGTPGFQSPTLTTVEAFDWIVYTEEKKEMHTDLGI